MLRVVGNTQSFFSRSRWLLVGLGALFASGCSSNDIYIICEDLTFLHFEPALSADGEYEIEVDLEGGHASCVATLVDGQIFDQFRCSGAGGAGPSIEMAFGHTIVETQTSRFQGPARTIDGLRWYGRSYMVAVAMKKDGVEVPARQVFFFQDAQPLEDCEAAHMVGTMATK